MKIENMREFIVFARYLNFTAAARHLYVTQPALSYRIAAMEKELGFLLVDRADPIRLTPAGKAFLADAQKIVSLYDASLARCGDVAAAKGGKLVIERPAGMPAASKGFDALVSTFARTHPTADIRLVRSDGHRLQTVLATGAVDAGVVFDEGCLVEAASERPRACDFAFAPLPCNDDVRPWVLVASNDPLATKEHLYIGDLDNRRLAFQVDPRFEAGRVFVKRMLEDRGVHVLFADKTERDDIDFVWGIAPDEIVLSDAGIVPICGAGLFASPERIARPLEDEGLAITPMLVFRAGDANPLLAEFLELVALDRANPSKN